MLSGFKLPEEEQTFNYNAGPTSSMYGSAFHFSAEGPMNHGSLLPTCMFDEEDEDEDAETSVNSEQEDPNYEPFDTESKDDNSYIAYALEHITVTKSAKEIPNLDNLTSLQRGNYAEIEMNNYFVKLGYNRIDHLDKQTLNTPSHHGIDGIFSNDNEYLIVEAKFGSARLGQTEYDGQQMSEVWIDARLDAAVGRTVANQIRKKGYRKILFRVTVTD